MHILKYFGDDMKHRQIAQNTEGVQNIFFNTQKRKCPYIFVSNSLIINDLENSPFIIHPSSFFFLLLPKFL